MRGRVTAAIMAAVVLFAMWRVSVSGVYLDGTRVMAASPVTAFEVLALPIAAVYWVFGRRR